MYRMEQAVRHNNLLTEVIEGLTRTPKKLPTKLFYDKKGSQLFEEISGLKEYYLTRCETEILQENIGDITSQIGSNSILIEFGSGSSLKTHLLLNSLPSLSSYIPIDISEEQLLNSVTKLKSEFPGLNILPICTDFTQHIHLPISKSYGHRRVAYYSGSSIGNFTPKLAKLFLRKIAAICGRNGAMLIGVDLKKDKSIIYQAYNDSMGITARFNMNVLERLNKEMGATFNLKQFSHKAFYNPVKGRIEMYLVSRIDQTVRVNNTYIAFKRGERILTEYSYKYTLEEFSAIAEEYFTISRIWTDKENYYALLFLTVKS